jgi:hypothetical protein
MPLKFLLMPLKTDLLISSRDGADLDYHIICPREAIIDDDPEVDEFIMTRILPKFADVVDEDVLLLLAE